MLRTLHNYKTICHVHRFSLLPAHAGHVFVRGNIYQCVRQQGINELKHDRRLGQLSHL